MTDKDVYDAADSFLKTMDDAPLGSETIFKTQESKDWMETWVHRALTKLSAAAYHCKNVGLLVVSAHDKAKSRSQRIQGRSKIGKMSMGGTFAVQEIAYEIDAFLAASRASIDFSAGIIALHLGMTRHTRIPKVLDWLSANPNTSLAFLLRQRPWIYRLREYRNQCVHDRTLRAHMGYEAVSTKGIIAEALIPFVLAENIPADRPDTRAAREYEIIFANDNECPPEGLSRLETKAGIVGNECLSEHSIRYEPSPGFVLVEEFCEGHMDKLRKFNTRLFKEVPKLRFALQRRTPAKTTSS